MKKEVKLTTFGSETEALMMADLLRSEGIPSILVPLGASQSAFGASVWRPFELRVRVEDEQRARDLLAELESGQYAEAPIYGELIEDEDD